MNIWRVFLCTSLLVAGCNASGFYSHLKKFAEFTLRELKSQRATGESEATRLTKYKTFTFNLDDEKIVLKLKLNERQKDHVPVKVVTKNKTHRVKDDAPRDYAFYQNVEEKDATKSAVMVRCPAGKKCHIVGRFEYKGETYFVEPTTHQPKKKGVIHGAHKVDVNNTVDNKDDTEVIKLNISTDVPEKSSNQQKRAQMNHVIELSMLIDYSIYKYWMGKKDNDQSLAVQTIKQYYEQVANNMDRIYTSATTETMTIDIVPYELVIMVDEASCPWIKSNMKTVGGVEYLNANVIHTFNTWALKHRSTFGNYDALMTFTRKDLAAIPMEGKVQPGVVGVARMYRNQAGDYISALCGDKVTYISVSIVQDFAASDVSATAAHELAHTMGVQHDYKLGCSTASQHVMAYLDNGNYLTSATASNPWTFSTCSINVMTRTMKLLANWKGADLCTQKHLYNVAEYNRVQTSKYLGEIYTLDDQCGLIYGDASEKCNIQSDSEQCYKGIYCLKPGTSDCEGLLKVMIGSTIGNKKCYKGKLVDKLP